MLTNQPPLKIHQKPGVYHTVRMSHLKSLLQGLELDFSEVEQLIVAAIKERLIKVCLFLSI